jgi:hypothetical protein
MKLKIILIIATVVGFGCSDFIEIDRDPPAPPRDVRVLALDNEVIVDWLPNREPDLAGYRVWVSERANGTYLLLGETRNLQWSDKGVTNGRTYYYAVTAFDFDGNESLFSEEIVSATPRPEGYDVRLNNFRISPNTAGYDFSDYSIGLYNDEYTDVFFEYFGSAAYFNVWNDTDIQDMGYTASLDDILIAPASGWSPSKSVEAIRGHTYVVWTWDDHYAKIRVIDVTSSRVTFDWAYQTAKSNPELKRPMQQDGKRHLQRLNAIAMMKAPR